MDRFEAMSILVAVVEGGSFTAASRCLGVPLPTVSRKLSELEAHLNSRLLTRSTRRLALTEAGASYVAACKRILEEVTDAERAASGEHGSPKGELIITAPLVFGRLHVVPVINAFLSAYPDINVRMVLSDRNAHLLDDHIDLAIRIGFLPDSSMVAVPVGHVHLVVCGSPDYFARHGVPKKPSDLTRFSCVTFDVLGSATSWDFATKTDARDRVVPIRSRFSVNTAEAALDAAMAGVGVTRVLSYQAATGIEEGRLQVVLDSFPSTSMPVSFVYCGQRQVPLKMRSFLDFTVPRLRACLADRVLSRR
jgi:DNA-binding transcriptional LysR family regulator